jgi:RimJ/RimL family protein N-acetyltransferase
MTTRAEKALVPCLETPRLILRGHRRDDFASVAAMWGDLEVAKHVSGKPSTPEESWARMLRYAGLWHLLGFGYWAVEEKASGRFAGEVGLGNFKREVEPPLGDDPEAGWVLMPWAHGKGYATEAMSAALAWSDAHLQKATVCIMAPENPASIRVAEKCGFRKFAEGTYKTWPTLIYRRAALAR